MSFAVEKSILVRDIESRSEMRAVEELQKQIWGVPDLDVVPLSQLAAATASGGVLIGAFDNEELVGFAYGFIGREHGAFVHHSHMLAVKPDYRGHDVGLRLKLAQRDRVLEQGIEVMTWTFDPLQSLNAYFNFHKLGVISDRYFVNFYGKDASSFLHRNGTDRLWVTWHLASERVAASPAGMPADVKTLVKIGDKDVPILNDLGDSFPGDHLGIEIPANINAVEAGSSKLASEWRIVTRTAFSEALRKGFFVESFYLSGRTDGRTGTYVLTRKT